MAGCGVTGRTTDARAHVQERRLGGELERIKQVLRCRYPTGMKLIQAGKILDAHSLRIEAHPPERSEHDLLEIAAPPILPNDIIHTHFDSHSLTHAAIRHAMPQRLVP